MKIDNLGCPNCGAPLELDKPAGLARCKYCSRDFEIEDDKKIAGQSVIINNNYYTADVSTAAEDLRKRQRNMSVCGLVTLVLLGLFLGNYGLHKSEPPKKTVNPQTAYASVTANLSDLEPDLYTVRKTPESAPVLTFLKAVFHKESVSAEDIATLKYLQIGRAAESLIVKDTDPYLFTYSTEDIFAEPEAERVTITVPASANSSAGDAGELFNDLQCFTGLTALDISAAGGVGRGTSSLKSLKQLKSYIGDSYQTVSGMKTAFADITQIRNLGLRLYDDRDIDAITEFTSLESLTASLGSDVSEVGNLAGLSALKNLTSLTVDPYYKNPDISWLSSLTGLKSLSILSAGNITDYSVLYGMPHLEELRIHYAKELKDIGFIAGMPKLKTLAVSDSQVRSLKPLEGRIGISSLSLVNNNDVADLSVMSSLTGLSTLEYKSYGYGKPTLPSMAKSEHLKNADISGNNINALVSNKIVNLKVSVTSEFDCAAVANIPTVESLSISSNGSGSIYNFESFSKLPSLKSLDLYDVDMGWDYGGDCGLFRLPSLENLSLYSTGGLEIDIANIPENTTLKRLRMESCNYLMVTKNGVPVQSDASKEFLPPVYFTPLFEKLTGLSELYLPSAGLENVEFAAGMKNLQVLDISDNYVSDIAPLAKLPQLRTLYCGKNPVQNLALLSNVSVL